jgi:hypothetical protein
MKAIECSLLPHVGTPVDEYLTRTNMKHDGVWGTDIEILTASSLFCTDVYVYTKVGNNNSVRKAAIDYISAYPEQFIESITENC